MVMGTALVIGTGPGLGRALARTFHNAGHPVAMFGRTTARLDEYATELTGGAPVAVFGVDVADGNALRAAITSAITQLGAPDVLLYNAAAIRADRPTDSDDDGWKNAFAVNVLGAKIAAETVIPKMRGTGSVLFTGGGLADAPSPEYASLSVGKAALRAYVQALAAEQTPHGIRATVININGGIDGGAEHLSSDALAHTYLDLHNEDVALWQPEVIRS